MDDTKAPAGMQLDQDEKLDRVYLDVLRAEAQVSVAEGTLVRAEAALAGLGFVLARLRLAAAEAGVVLSEGQREPALPVEPSVLIDADEAARLLDITRDALDKRVQRHRVPGVVRSGRRVQFNRERLLAGINKRTNR